jgi:hypothetical protein
MGKRERGRKEGEKGKGGKGEKGGDKFIRHLSE